MELNIDLLKRETKSRFRVIAGILFLIMGIVQIIFSNNYRMGKLFNWTMFTMWMLNGIVHIMEGLGYPFEGIFGKAYIIINSDLISLKSSVFEKEQSVNWNDIKSIDYKLNRYIIQKVDNKTLVIDLTKFEYFLNKEIKKTIDYFAQEKNLQEYKIIS